MAKLLFDWFGFDQTTTLICFSFNKSITAKSKNKTGGQPYKVTSPYKVFSGLWVAAD